MKSSMRFRLALGAVASLSLVASAFAPQDSAAKQQAVDRHKAAAAVWKLLPKSCESPADCEALVLWSQRLAQAACEAGAVPEREAYQQHLARVQQARAKIRDLHEAGRRSAAVAAVMRFHVVEAQRLAKQ